MRVLVTQENAHLGAIWCQALHRIGAKTELVADENAAIAAIGNTSFDVIVLCLNVKDGSAMAVSDYASYRSPEAKIILVTVQNFFSDGSVFSYLSNACAMVPSYTPAYDLAALVDYHAR
jgi:DNA-binding response OmpR family regulator